MRCRLSWTALPLLLLCTALVLANPPKQNPPKPPPPHPHAGMPHWHGNGNMPRPVMAHIDYQLEPTADMVVRLLNPPLQYDDKGSPKKYTAAELKEMKGDNPKLVGYNGAVTDLKTGLQVKVYVVKDPPPTKEDAKKDEAKADKPDKPKYVPAGELTGQLTQTGNSEKGLTLRVSYQTWQGAGWRPPINGGANQKDAPTLQVSMIVVLTQPAQEAPGK
jgi:hypothetical protein